MHIRSHFIQVAFCLALLGGCTTGHSPTTVSSQFPETPAAALVKTPDQCAKGPGQNICSLNGGWGFSRADAFVLAVPTGYRQKGAHYNTIPLESHLIRTRNQVEFTDTPTKGQRYVVADYGTVSRTLSAQNGRMYSVWRGQVRILPEEDSPALHQNAPGSMVAQRGIATAPGKARMVAREYWFDITATSHSNGAATRGVSP